MTEQFDAIIIGAGQAGPPLAGRLTSAGMRVALIERHLLGGTCVNTGCMPTKTLVASARAAHVARHAAHWGVSAGPVSVDIAAVKARAHTVTRNAREGLSKFLGELPGLTLIQGQARFRDAHLLQVGDRMLSAPRIFINVGGRALLPDMPGAADVTLLTNTSMLALDTLPRHLAVVGGSYVGLEFAQMYRRFGAEVTIVERGERLISREDPDISEAIRSILEAEGITVRLGAECIAFAPDGDAIEVKVDCATDARSITASHVLMAVGRRPNTDDLGLAEAGVAIDGRGYIQVDDALATTVAGIWALGDCNGRGAFTHTAYNDYEIVAADLLDGARRKVSDRATAYALYTDPPLGRAGMTEAEVRAAGRPYLVSTRPMSRVGRAVEMGETAGCMRAIVDAETHRILGAAILGVHGDEAIHGILDTINASRPFEELQRSVPIHPTVSELIPTLLEGLAPPTGAPQLSA